MNYTVEKYDDNVTEDIEIAKTVVAKCENLETLIDTWLIDATRKICFSTGLDDDMQHTLIAVTLGIEDNDSAIFYMPIQQIKTLYKDISSPSPDDDIDDMEERERELGATYSDELCERIFPRKHLLKICLGYALLNIGEASINLIDRRYLEDQECDPTQFTDKKIGLIHAGYRNPETGKGFCEHFYVQW